MTPRKMMGRGLDGGCGSREMSCPVSRVSIREALTPKRGAVDLYAQAEKALCERSPFDSEEAASSVSTLPVGLGAALSKYSDRRRKHKKSPHSEQAGISCDAKNLWSETEDYFRFTTLEDIGKLLGKSNFRKDSCLSMPNLPPNVEENDRFNGGTVLENVAGLEVAKDNCSVVPMTASQEKPTGVEDVMEVDCTRTSEACVKRGVFDALQCKDADRWENSTLGAIDLHWLFGSRNKVLLSPERPSKKRKLLGEEAGFEKLVSVGTSPRGNSYYCHACCSCDINESNILLSCDSCKVRVHQRCYGVRNSPSSSWFCSYCRERGRLKPFSTETLPEVDIINSSYKPCVICPKDGGALKPVERDAENSTSCGDVKFAHLFCSLWMPEVYVENLEAMEPLMNIGGIKDTRRRLTCFLCKEKHGACIRCSHGTCRTYFHPMCAKDANLSMEIWGKVGCDNVLLRAFCSKHSTFQEDSVAQELGNITSLSVSDSPASNMFPLATLGSKSHKIKIVRKNRDNNIVDDKGTVENCNTENKAEKHLEADSLAMQSNNLLECMDAKSVTEMEKERATEKENSSVAIANDPCDLGLLLKKLINERKVSLKNIESEAGIPSELLRNFLMDKHANVPFEWRTKLIDWLRKYNFTCIPFGYGVAQAVASSAVDGVGLNLNAVVSTSLIPRKIAEGKIKDLKGNKMVCSSAEMCDVQNNISNLILEIGENVPPTNEEIKKDGINMESVCYDHGNPSKESTFNEEASLDHSPQINMAIECHKDVQELQPPLISLNMDEVDVLNDTLRSSREQRDCLETSVISLRYGESISSSYIHPFINKKLMQMWNLLYLKPNDEGHECEGQMDKAVSTEERTCSANFCCHDQALYSRSSDVSSKFVGGQVEKLVEASKLGIMELSPGDEVEGEILYFQNRLLENAVANMQRCEELMLRVVENLPHELDELRKQRWDAVFVNQYLREVREAKKRGRKERRHREAQAVLAAATAVAAASSRSPSFRKDLHYEAATTQHEGPMKANTVSGRSLSHSQSVQAKETLPRMCAPKISSGPHVSSEFRHPQTCDICRRRETILNQLYVCCSCKVSVHLGCYNSSKEFIRPWFCELCQDLGQERSSSTAVCVLCGRTTGAFRKSFDGQWVHAFCAEWLLESTYRRGQSNPVEGMEGVLKDRSGLFCSICHCKHGVCLKCNHMSCQVTFHPHCAKSAGLHLNVRSVGGKLQYKAYCENHGLGRKEDETEQNAAEELCQLKHIRVELEKLRLLCERIIKREKLKKELVLCSHDILASRRDNAAYSVLVRSSFLPPDVSSESVTTSVRGYTDDTKSCSETVQRYDDVTEDSTVSGTCRKTLPIPMGGARRTNDSSTSKRPFTQRPTYRVQFSGKKLPQKPVSFASQNAAIREKSKTRKPTETFHKEVLMTSDQASLRNQRLPKGYVYVPVSSLAREKHTGDEGGSRETQESDG